MPRRTDLSKIGPRIRRFRRRRGLRQEDLAKLISVTRLSIVRYEHGRVPRLVILGRIAKALRVPLTKLVQ
jgi:transcriptional regulator with XRE-family HTH domain